MLVTIVLPQMSSRINIEQYEIGSLLSCKTTWEDTIIGYLYAYNPEKTQIILEIQDEKQIPPSPKFTALYSLDIHGDHTICILPLTSATSITTLTPCNDLPPEKQAYLAQALRLSSKSVDSQAVDSRLKTSLERIHDNQPHVGVGIPESAQILFNKLNDMFADFLFHY